MRYNELPVFGVTRFMKRFGRSLWAIGKFRVFTIPLWYWVAFFAALVLLVLVLSSLGIVKDCPENSECLPWSLPS
jgi:hypothetical protein